MFNFFLLKKNIDSLIAATAGFIVILFFTRHGGIGVCPDGVAYLATSENFCESGKLVDFTQNALVDFPLLYPLFLSCLTTLTGLKPLLFAPFLNATLFALLIYISGYIMEQFSYKSKWYKAAALSCKVLSPCLLEVYSMVWSETVFILLLMFFMIAIHQYFRSYSRKALIAAAILAALASVTRYAGLTIIATGGLLLLLDMKLPVRKKISDVLIYCSITPILLIINLSRNIFVSGTLSGLREKSVHTIKDIAYDTGTVFYNWLPFKNNNYKGAVWIVIILLAIILFICIQQFLKKKRFTSYQNIAAIFSLVFIVFMLLCASKSRFEQMNSRLLSPVFIPLLWCCSNWLVYAWKKTGSANKQWIMALGALILFIFQYSQIINDYETWDGVKDAGIPGYTEDQWRYSETVQYIKKDFALFNNNSTVYSNAYDAIHFFTGKPGKFLPHKEFKHEVQQFLSNPHCYMIWFTDGDNPDLVDISFITNVKKMRLMKQFNDGAIYEYGN